MIVTATVEAKPSPTMDQYIAPRGCSWPMASDARSPAIFPE
jgi:hypothetical protein